jgi:hypothetical protein
VLAESSEILNSFETVRLLLEEIKCLSFYCIMALKTTENTTHAQNNENFQNPIIQDKISRFLERKFRRSRSFQTINAYDKAIKKFLRFLSVPISLNHLENMLNAIIYH